MTRQLTIDDVDAYDVVMHLYCSFQYEPSPALRDLGDGGTVFDAPVDSYWDDALDLPGYRGVRDIGAEPVALSVEFTES